MPKQYDTYEQALRRVENLKRTGAWPGIVGPDKNGFYHLTWDPGDQS